MPAMTVRRPSALLLTSMALAGPVLAGCGSDDGPTASDTSETVTPASAASEFPAADGKTLPEIAAAADAKQTKLVIAPTQNVYHEGENRFGFGVFEVDQTPVDDADIAIYASPVDKPAVGPFPATIESLQVDPQFTSQTTSQDPDAATTVYHSEAKLDGPGEWRIMAMIRNDDGSYEYSLAPSAVVKKSGVPQPGDPAPVIHTPTVEDAGGDLAKIDTRQPPDTMHDLDFADVVGKEPVVLLFATPALCASRVCGPVVDIEEQAKAERPDDAAYIHMEIYEDNDVNKGPRQQVTDFNLLGEPWLFVIDADGKVSTAIQGAFGPDELDRAIDQVAKS